MTHVKRVRLELTDEQREIVRRIREEVESDNDAILASARAHMQADLAAIARLKDSLKLMAATRRESGVSLNELAERTGISKSALSRIENDPSPNVTLATLERYANGIGKSVVVTLVDRETKRSAGRRI